MVLGWVPLTKPLSRRAATVSPMPNYQATLKSVVLLCGLNFICFQKTFFLLPPSLLSSVLLFSFLSPPPFFLTKRERTTKCRSFEEVTVGTHQSLHLALRGEHSSP